MLIKEQIHIYSICIQCIKQAEKSALSTSHCHIMHIDKNTWFTHFKNKQNGKKMNC